MEIEKRKKDYRPLIIALLSLLIIGLVIGGTFAYFTSTFSIPNVFNSKPYSTKITEDFVSPSNWTPGTVTSKKFNVTNTGDVDVAVRVSYTESWVSANGDPLPLTQNNERVALIQWYSLNNWTNSNGYFYYNYKLTKNESTQPLIKAVEFNKNVVNDANCVTSGNEITCTSSGDGYDGATYTLTITAETVQYDAYRDYWGTNAIIADSSAPARVGQFVAVNPTPTLNIGKEFCMDDECFYILNTNSTTTSLITKYNVVYSSDPSVLLPKQNSTESEYTWFSTTNYWHDTTNNVLKTAYAKDYSNNTASYSVSPYPYVYDSNSILNIRVTEYVTYLTDVLNAADRYNLGTNISRTNTVGRVPSFEEIETIMNNSGGNIPLWIQGDYWTGSAAGGLNGVNIWKVTVTSLSATSGINQGNISAGNYGPSGCRVVIEVPTSSLQ